jgi:hypothetical protein
MRTITGAILLVGAEQAFAHAHLVSFPHEVLVRDILIPVSIALAVLGCGFLVWGAFSDRSISGGK